MSDPLDELRNLGKVSRPGRLAPQEVRRRGDRMRRRRTAVQALTAAAAVLAIASGGALAAGNLTSTAPRPVDPAAPTSSADPSATTSPSPSPSTAPAVASEIPEDFPLAQDIDAPEGVYSTDLQRDDTTDQSWYALPCTDPDEQVSFAGDERRTAARLVRVEGDVWAKSRQLLVYDDFAAAERAFTQLGRSLSDCSRTGDTPTGAQPMHWSVENMSGNEDTPAWVIAQGSSVDDGSHPYFVDLTATQVGRSIFVSWSGRGQKERLPWQRLENSHEVVLRAAWCLWMEGPCGSVETESTPSFKDVNITRGLPEPGGDVPEWTRSEGVPLSAAACGGPEDLPATPVADYRVEVSPPDENAWRHLLVFEDERAAAALMDQLRSSAVVCNEILGTPADDPTDPSEMRWNVSELPGSPGLVAIDGLAFADGNGDRVPGRVLTRAVQVGKAVLVAQVSDASSRLGTDEVAANLTEDVRGIVSEMCAVADGSCETG